MKRAFKKILGITLIVLGLFALLTPFTPGSWLALIGLELLGIRLLVERTFLSFLPCKQRRAIRRWLRKFSPASRSKDKPPAREGPRQPPSTAS